MSAERKLLESIPPTILLRQVGAEQTKPENKDKFTVLVDLARDKNTGRITHVAVIPFATEPEAAAASQAYGFGYKRPANAEKPQYRKSNRTFNPQA